MEHLKMQSRDLVSDNMRYIAERWPECLTETKDERGRLRQAIDFERLRQLLSADAVGEGQERYQFTWPDKRHAIRLANAPITDTLRPCREESINFDTTQNLYIEGDNLNVLKLLRESYLGKVKMIYIDPPYNTGGDFVYKDNFIKKNSDYADVSGAYDEHGNLLVGDLEKNADSNGRFHTDWLNMIYPRLKVARDLLSEDGVIFISIDDNEQRNLKNICDEVFGEANFVVQLVWEQGRKSMAAQVAVNHEYCLVYSKNRTYAIENSKNTNYRYWMTPKIGLEPIYTEYNRLSSLHGKDYQTIELGMRRFYQELPDGNPSKAHSHYKCVDEKGLYFPGDIAQGTGKGGRFNIIHPVTGKPVKVPAGGWRFGQDKLPLLLKEGRIHFGSDETTVPCLKRYLSETEGEVMASVFYKDGRGASKRLETLLEQKGIFPYPKDETVIQSFIRAASNNISEEIILDFFSGSATTAHAVMQLNAEDGGNRKFIMVQLPEETDEKSEARKAGYKNICEIGKERIRRAGKKIKEESPLTTQDLDTGFRVLKLDSSNMEDVFYTPAETTEQTLFSDNIKPDRTDEDLLFQVMLELGILLSDKIEKTQVAGKTVWNVGEGYLMACFEENVNEYTIKAIAKQKPAYFVMADRSLESDNVADNFEQLFEEYSPETIRRII